MNTSMLMHFLSIYIIYFMLSDSCYEYVKIKTDMWTGIRKSTKIHISWRRTNYVEFVEIVWMSILVLLVVKFYDQTLTNLFNSMDDIGTPDPDWKLQDDNTATHRAKIAKDFKSSHGIRSIP